MMYRVEFALSFRDDVDLQIEYLLSEGAALATIERWFAWLFDKAKALEEFPERYPVDKIQSEVTGEETRRFIVDDYLVFYQVDHDQRKVSVVAFVHGATRKEV